MGDRIGRILRSLQEEDDPLSFLGARDIARPRWGSDVTDLSDLIPLPGFDDLGGRDLHGRELIPRGLDSSGTILDLRDARDDDEIASGGKDSQVNVRYLRPDRDGDRKEDERED
jgi:hypothetical protein